MRPRRRLLLFLILLCLTVRPAGSEMLWDESAFERAPAAETYVKQVNLSLLRAGVPQINTLFECYETFAVLGITQAPQAENVEDIEITLFLESGKIRKAELHLCDQASFVILAAAMTAIASGEAPDVSLKSFMDYPEKFAKTIQQDPLRSIECTVDEMQGDTVRVYCAYTPNEYGDGTAWITYTLIFPRETEEKIGSFVTPPPETEKEIIRDGTDDDGDYAPYDEGTHLEIFVTPTPEPDSAAAEEWSP